MQNLDHKKTWPVFITFIVIVLGVVGYFSWRYYRDVSSEKEVDTVILTNSQNTSKLGFFEKNILITTNNGRDAHYNSEIWEYNFYSQKSEKIADGWGPSLSPDKKTLAFVSGDNCGIGLYDIASKQTKMSPKLDNSSQNPCDLSEMEKWSPDEKYVIADSGTGIGREKLIYKISNVTSSLSFLAMGLGYDWLDNSMIVYAHSSDASQAPRDDGSERDFNIDLCSTDINSGKVTVLKKATSLTEYSLNFVENKYIYFNQYDVKSPSDWTPGDGKAAVTYWRMQVNGSNVVSTKVVKKENKALDSLNLILSNSISYKQYQIFKYQPVLNDGNIYFARITDSERNNFITVSINAKTKDIEKLDLNVSDIAYYTN